ncbi:unnamed protein product [Rhizophagus irregularis]|nr:unnamed protein product [Rhizophagus irregularis]
MPSNISHTWYTTLVAQDPNNRHAIQRSNGCWSVIDYSAGLRVLDLHNEAKAFDFNTNNIYNEEYNRNSGYILSRNQEEERALIPLLPGYVVFTAAGKKRFKLSILERNNQLLFLWEEFGLDTSYTNKKAQGVEQLAFHCMLKEYGLESNNTIRKFAMQCKKKEETLRRSLKRGQKEINTILCEEEGNSNSQNIRFGIQIESNGKVLSPKDTQVLMLKNLEYKQEIYSQNKTIKKLKNKITSINNDAENTIETNITTLNDAEIRKSVEKEMEERQLGSVIFMSTSQYLSILLSLPCPNCLDLIASNRTFYTRISGFNIYCVITCLLCKTSTQYSNEESGMKYSQVVAGAALAGGVNRNSFQTALATIGVTNQCCKKSYFNCQARMYKPIIDSAKSSCEAILYEILDHLESAHLPSQEKVLPIAVLDQNDGLDVMMAKVYTAATNKDFSYPDMCNILNFVKERSQKELVSYKSKAPEQIRKDLFWPSFGELLRDFDVIVKCIACHAFAKKSARGLCGVCSFYVDVGLWERIVNDKYIPKGLQPELPGIDKLIPLAAKKIFGFENFREGQVDAIMAYLSGKDTFVSLKTGGGKTLCYALSAICFEGLTIVFSPLKALMDDQKRELINAGIPCATLYANLLQGASIQEKIFEEIACGLIKILFVTPEKLASNNGFCREAWGRLGILKQCWGLAPIMLLTATCTRSEVNEICANLTIEENNFALIRGSTSHRSEIIFNVRERKEIRDQYVTEIISIINANLFGRIIIYCAIHSSCEYLYNKLQENLADIIVDYFHGGLRDNEREKAMNNWKSNFTQIIVATSAFGMGINSNDIRVVIHAEAPMSMTNLIQVVGRAGRDGNTAKHFIFYSKKDIRTNYSIIAEYRETASISANINIGEQRLINKLEPWPNEEKPPVCKICDNCINRITDKPRLIDGKEEIIKLLEVVEYLTQEMGEQICPDDVIIDVFRGGKTAKIKQKNWNTLPVYPAEKRKVLKTKDLVQFALTDLVVRGLVQETIILRKPFEGSKILSSSIVVVGVVPGAQANANVQTWHYFVK